LKQVRYFDHTKADIRRPMVQYNNITRVQSILTRKRLASTATQGLKGSAVERGLRCERTYGTRRGMSVVQQELMDRFV
jgi:hypothetical protein